MKSYIFITAEGYTYQPESNSIEPDIENCQVIGFAKGSDKKHAFENLLNENPDLLETTFDEIICYEFSDDKMYFNLNDCKPTGKLNKT